MAELPIQNNQPKLMYPDVLGAITKNRISVGKLQFAIGVFPQQAFLNQPIEMVAILQNMMDQPMQVKVALQPPKADKRGNPAVFDIAKRMVGITLKAGEVGALRIPLVPTPPTKAASEYPLRVAVRYRVPDDSNMVRAITGGAKPSVLSVSPFKLQVLRDVNFEVVPWNQSAEIVTTTFSLAPKTMPRMGHTPKPTYETLWTHEEMVNEVEKVQSMTAAAHAVSATMGPTSVYSFVFDAVNEQYAERGLPLHPGEAAAITKMLCYTLDEGIALEQHINVEESRWFQTLCQVLAHTPEVENMLPGEIAATYLLDSMLYDATLLAFRIVQSNVKEFLGNKAEQINYVNRMLLWFGGQGTPDLTFVYLPLVLGGILVNAHVVPRDENPWSLIDGMWEAKRGREKLVHGETTTIFDLTDQLLDKAEVTLRRLRISRL